MAERASTGRSASNGGSSSKSSGGKQKGGEVKSLRDLFVEELRDLYSAESQLIEALPKMEKAASSQELTEAFRAHLQQTKEHQRRLDTIFESLGMSPQGKMCKGMQGLIEEGKEVIDEIGDSVLRDAALIGAAQRVEHYEIAGYGTVRTFAQELGDENAKRILQETLDEEGEADRKLTAIAEGRMYESGVNEMAMSGRSGGNTGRSGGTSGSQGR